MSEASASRPVRRLSSQAVLGAAAAFVVTEALAVVAMARVRAEPAFAAPAATVSLAELLLSFAVATVVLLFLLRTVKSGAVYTAMFFAAIAIGIWGWFGVFLPAPTAFLLAASIAALALGIRRVWTADLAIALGVAGVAVAFAAVTDAATMLAFLAILAFYDIIAVYRTRHMVGMARSLLERGATFALLVPSRLRGLRVPVREASVDKGFFVLGTGDLAMPTAFVAIAARSSLPVSVASAVGSVLGFLAMAAIFSTQKEPKPMAALPPIAAGTALGYLLGMILL